MPWSNFNSYEGLSRDECDETTWSASKSVVSIRNRGATRPSEPHDSLGGPGGGGVWGGKRRRGGVGRGCDWGSLKGRGGVGGPGISRRQIPRQVGGGHSGRSSHRYQPSGGSNQGSKFKSKMESKLETKNGEQVGEQEWRAIREQNGQQIGTTMVSKSVSKSVSKYFLGFYKAFWVFSYV